MRGTDMQEIRKAILKIYEDSNYDLMDAMCPLDPAFDEHPKLVPSYRIKYAVSKFFKPRTILEIGVRYGYSAFAFLTATPTAMYHGWDADNVTHGGAKGAYLWAQQELRKWEFATCELKNSQEQIVEGQLDLIHIDGQQDWDGIYHDLKISAPSAKWILYDGYNHQNNRHPVDAFLDEHKLPHVLLQDFPGDLLIKCQS